MPFGRCFSSAFVMIDPVGVKYYQTESFNPSDELGSLNNRKGTVIALL